MIDTPVSELSKSQGSEGKVVSTRSRKEGRLFWGEQFLTAEETQESDGGGGSPVLLQN